MLTSILIILAIINGIQNEDKILDISHPYEMLSFDKSILTDIKLHRKRRSIDKELENRLKRDLENENLYGQLDDYDKHLEKHNVLHMYTKLPDDEFKSKDKQDYKLSDDDQFNKNKKLNQFKNKYLNDEDHHFKLTFNAHNRKFKLLLKGKSNLNDVFAPDVEFESTNGKFHFDKDNIINGYLEGEKDSFIEGVITHDGLIDGLIRTDDEEYYVEPLRNYLKHDKIKEEFYSNKSNSDFHSIIYKLSDLTFPNFTCNHDHHHNLHKRETNEFNTKKSSENDHSIKSLRYTNNLTNSINHIEPDLLNNKYLQAVRKNSMINKNLIKKQNKTQSQNGNRKYYWNRPYIRDMDALHYMNSEAYGVRTHIQRTHWSSDISDTHLVVDSRKTTCMLYLQADHLFYNRMGSEEACVETMIRHVQKVNSIYRVTDFDQDGKSDNISFLIKRIKVHTSDALKDSEYRFPANYGVERFLELFSEDDYDAFCLAYMFTYRDFEGGTLGLAWTGDLKNAGGLCEKQGHYRGSLKSLNTGIVTLLNYGKSVPPIVSHVTLAHEIGHNFGSPHDPEEDSSCTPGGENGNYIMFARATSGDKKNNNKFSPCSLKSINAVLNLKARSLKGCFQEPQEAICGNGVVEPNEMCDCGWVGECDEPCCFPMQSNPPADEKPCSLRPGFACSPSQGPCCTHDTCKLKVGNKCRDDNGCRTSSYCSGQGPQCPPSVNKPNKTICNEESVCYMGECTGSICLAYSLESCQCKRKEGVEYKRGDPLCELCCRMPGDDSTCKSSFEWNDPPYDVPDLLAKPGSPCNQYLGYCDVNQVCREIHPTGALSFIKYLLSDESISLIRNWIQHQWICAGILCCVAFVLCTLLLRALRNKAQKQRETCKSTSNILGAAGILANNSISTGFLPTGLFNHSPATNSTTTTNISNNSVLQSANENSNSNNTYTNAYNSTYGNNANYSNAYGAYTPISANTRSQQSSIQPTTTYSDYADYGNPSLIQNSNITTPTTVDQNQSIYGTTAGLKSTNQTTSYLNNNQNNSTYTTSSLNPIDNDVKNLTNNYTSMNLNNINGSNQLHLSNLANLSSNLPNSRQPPTYSNQYNTNYTPTTSYNSNNLLINRQNRLSNAINNSTSLSSYKTSNSSANQASSSSNRSGLNKNYNKSNNISFSNQQSYNQQHNQLNQPNYQSYQAQYQFNNNFQQQQQQPTQHQSSHHLHRTNSTSATSNLPWV